MQPCIRVPLSWYAASDQGKQLCQPCEAQQATQHTYWLEFLLIFGWLVSANNFIHTSTNFIRSVYDFHGSPHHITTWMPMSMQLRCTEPWWSNFFFFLKSHPPTACCRLTDPSYCLQNCHVMSLKHLDNFLTSSQSEITEIEESPVTWSLLLVQLFSMIFTAKNLKQYFRESWKFPPNIQGLLLI